MTTAPATSVAELRPRQRWILNEIRRVVRARGYPPTLRELGSAVGLASASSVANQLRQLERLGYIRRGPGPRAIELVEHVELERLVAGGRRPVDDVDVVLHALAHLPQRCQHRPAPEPGDPPADCCATGTRAADAREAIAALARITQPTAPAATRAPASARFRGGIHL